ncbi:LacI family transcriptional regulator [Arthrobacter sp. MYb23]|uniref:LacI family DNA-binding transcriptional regulator n=1 Tax=unclassified Arthrobacter TaxID=235627 RepID=UPI000CFC8ACA|nr:MULTISPECIES: LacI family DNA-binding transcriptional regulator [unclassified Arthrobacter]PRB43461.1 LacI family transcriptional regulator [Arthrobacter sp. MYb51]PRB93705.1 LacI family transcriptional regulator [Arthrobacter sp. MYb23]
MTNQTAQSLAEVARYAGVSLSTASRALNDAYGVSAATRMKVLAAASDLDYVVSPDASRLARGTMGRVAVVVPHIERWFFGQMVSGIERVLSAADLDLMLYHVGDAVDRRDFLARLPARRKVDAVVVVAFPVNEEDRARLELIGAKIIAAGGQSASYPYVCIDDYEAGRLAMDHLLSLGHRRIAMIAGTDPDQPGWPAVSGRTRAYEEALRETGIEPDPSLTRVVDWGPLNAANAMEEILDSTQETPTAVFTHSDELAFGALRTLRRRGLRVPEDISLIGIDNHPMAEVLELTTVAQDVSEQGAAAGRLVLRALAGEGSAVAGTGEIAPIKLVTRSSTRKV